MCRNMHMLDPFREVWLKRLGLACVFAAVVCTGWCLCLVFDKDPAERDFFVDGSRVPYVAMADGF